MPLKLFKQTTDKTHGLSVAEKGVFRNQKPTYRGCKRESQHLIRRELTLPLWVNNGSVGVT
jgi:hypothetical protein